MTFLETFSAVFIATLMAQFSSWWFKKELEHRLDRGYDRLFKRGGISMNKLVLDVERGANGGLIVTNYVKSNDAAASIGSLKFGSKSEKLQLVFAGVKELSSWIESELKK